MRLLNQFLIIGIVILSVVTGTVFAAHDHDGHNQFYWARPRGVRLNQDGLNRQPLLVVGNEAGFRELIPNDDFGDDHGPLRRDELDPQRAADVAFDFVPDFEEDNGAGPHIQANEAIRQEVPRPDDGVIFEAIHQVSRMRPDLATQRPTAASVSHCLGDLICQEDQHGDLATRVKIITRLMTLPTNQDVETYLEAIRFIRPTKSNWDQLEHANSWFEMAIMHDRLTDYIMQVTCAVYEHDSKSVLGHAKGIIMGIDARAFLEINLENFGLQMYANAVGRILRTIAALPEEERIDFTTTAAPLMAFLDEDSFGSYKSMTMEALGQIPAQERAEIVHIICALADHETPNGEDLVNCIRALSILKADKRTKIVSALAPQFKDAINFSVKTHIITQVALCGHQKLEELYAKVDRKYAKVKKG